MHDMFATKTYETNKLNCNLKFVTFEYNHREDWRLSEASQSLAQLTELLRGQHYFMMISIPNGW